MAKMLAPVLLFVLSYYPVQASQVHEKPESLWSNSNIADVAEEALIAIVILAILDRTK